MKRKNVKVGQTVKVKKSTIMHTSRIGLIGKVVLVEPLEYKGIMTLKVKFEVADDGGDYYDWFNHGDIKLIKDVIEE